MQVTTDAAYSYNDNTNEESDICFLPERTNPTKHNVQIRPVSSFSRTEAENWCPPAPVISERHALRNILTRINAQGGRSGGEASINIYLTDFEIYKAPGSKGEYELYPLHYFGTKVKNLCFSGFLEEPGHRYFVQHIPIVSLSVDGYGNTEDPGTTIYIQSELCQQSKAVDIWFQLRRPTPIYAQFYTPFVWIADFGKHVLDYLKACPVASVELRHFRVDFHRWVHARFGHDPRFAAWQKEYGKQDYRCAVNAYVDYLNGEAVNLPSFSTALLSHPVWGECLCQSVSAIPIKCERTVVTPFVYQFFKNMYFADWLQVVAPSDVTLAKQQCRISKYGFARAPVIGGPQPESPIPGNPAKIKIGDVVAVRPDEDGKWKTSDQEWLAYVQGIDYSGEQERNSTDATGHALR